MARSRPTLAPVEAYESGPSGVPTRDVASPAPGTGEPGPFEQTWQAIKRHPLLILQATIIVAAAAFIYSVTREDEYTASASVLFADSPGVGVDLTGATIDPNRRAATNEELLSLGVVSDLAADRLSDVAPGTIGSAVSVVSSPDSDIYDIEATTSDAQLSADIANAYGRAFIAFRRDSVQRQYERALTRARAAEQELTPAEADGRRGEQLRARINELENAAALETGDAELVQLASAPTERSAPKPVRNAVLGGLLGLLIGLGLALLRDRTDQRVKSVEEIEAAYGRPVLAKIPRSRAIERGDSLPARGAEIEAFRMLRSSLRYLDINNDMRTLAITSALPAEGKSAVAGHLARTMAAMGDRVVLVEADLHGGGTAAGGVGLSEVLIGANLEDALIEQSVGRERRSLAILPAGGTPPNPSELLESRRMSDVLDQLEARFDLVVLDTPPVTYMSDAMALIEQASAVVIVSAVGTGTRGSIRDTRDRLGLLLGNRPVGVVVNFAPTGSAPQDTYYGGGS